MTKSRNYSDKLKDPRWQKRRLKTFERDNWRCQLCGDSETTLNVHHIKYGKEPWDVPDEYLITLCEHCHLEVEKLNKEFEKRFDFQKIKLHKAVDFAKNSRTMFASIDGLISVRRYNAQGAIVGEFNISGKDLKDLKKLMIYTLKAIPEIKF